MAEHPPTAKRTREAPEVRRARILDAAIGLIGERGYYGFTIQELGKRCGLSNPGLLHYFPSKHDVMLAVLQEMEVRGREFMEPLAQLAFNGRDGSGSPENVLDVLRAMVIHSTANPMMVRLAVELHAESLDASHPAHGWWRQRQVNTLNFLTRLLEAFVDDPQAVARQVLALMDGLCLQWLSAYPDLDALTEWNRALVRHLPELQASARPSAVVARECR